MQRLQFLVPAFLGLLGCSQADGPGASAGGSNNGGTPPNGGSAGESGGSGGNPSGGPGGIGAGGLAGNAGAGVGGAGGAGGAIGAGGAGMVYLSGVCELGVSTNGLGPLERDLSGGENAARDGGPLTLDGTIYGRGLGVHAPSDIAYALNGGCSKLSATIGIDDAMRNAGSVTFEVWGDGNRLYQSPVLTGASAPLPIDVDVAGVGELHLVAVASGQGAGDHADWADAALSCSAVPPAACAPVPGEVAPPPGYHLAWSDEFDKDGPPDPTKWGFDLGFVRNQELQWYQSDNASVKAGFLIIEGKRERVLNPNYQAGSAEWQKNRQYAEYTSSSLQTMNRYTFKYGRVEMRGRIATTQGLWPAFWTLGSAAPWPASGEIDIMEYYNTTLLANFAWAGPGGVDKWDAITKPVSSFGDANWDRKFHVWAADWNDQEMKLWLDGVLMNEAKVGDLLNPDGQSPFRQEHFLLVNLAIGANGGDPSATTFPSRVEVDYIRVFQPN
ncbi:MAG TPA: NPCBM/NEW2 domain-containing protein [Polyangiaceae bacterium]|nr:NPCBM/NEW2 domain-containing protein [Polyangiaceae bacterium]